MPGLGFLFRDRASAADPAAGAVVTDPNSEFVAAYTTATAAIPSEQERIERFDLDGVTVWDAEVASGYPGRVVADAQGVTRLGNDTVTRYTRGGTVLWTWTDPEASGEYLNDAISDEDGNTYIPIITGSPNYDILIYKVMSGGTSSVFATIDISAESIDDGEVVSCDITRDGEVLVLLHEDFSVSKTTLIGLRLSDQAVIWKTGVEDEANGWTQYATVRRGADSDVLYTAVLGKSASGSHVVVSAFNHPNSGAAPTQAWSQNATTDASVKDVRGLAVNATRVFVGHEASDPGEGNHYCLSTFGLAGNVGWTLAAANFESDGVAVAGGGVAASDDLALVALEWDSTRFPTGEFGLVLLAVTSGSEQTKGVFPLEVDVTGGVAALPNAEVDALTTTDGFPLGTTDGTNLETTEA